MTMMKSVQQGAGRTRRSEKEKRQSFIEGDAHAKKGVSMREFSVNKPMRDFVSTHSVNKTSGRNNVMVTKRDVKMAGRCDVIVKDNRKKQEKKQFNYLEFLDRHYRPENLGPGRRSPTYTMTEYEQVISNATDVFAKEKTLIEIDPPVTIVGDIHGQFNDLINIFLLHGLPPQRRYVFLGDYVDRGHMSIQCVMLLFAYKTYYPNDVFLLRGNHECPRVNRNYGFLDDCAALENGEVIFALFTRAFNQLPIAAVVGCRILCMHGGLSPELDSLDRLRNFKKPIRNPFRGLVSDMLWADPNEACDGWKRSPRGTGLTFGKQIVKEVLEKFQLDLIVRAHQVCLDGFSTFGGQVLTIFSAPGYEGEWRNAATIFQVCENLNCTIIAFVPNYPKTKDLLERGKLWDECLDA